MGWLIERLERAGKMTKEELEIDIEEPEIDIEEEEEEEEEI